MKKVNPRRVIKSEPPNYLADDEIEEELEFQQELDDVLEEENG